MTVFSDNLIQQRQDKNPPSPHRAGQPPVRHTEIQRVKVRLAFVNRQLDYLAAQRFYKRSIFIFDLQE